MSAENVAIVSAISGLIAAVVAATGLFYTGKSYTKLSKAEELRTLNAMNAEIARGFKEHNILQAEFPKDEEEKAVYWGKVYALLTFLLERTFDKVCLGEMHFLLHSFCQLS